MARYPELENLYAIYKKFETNCLLNDNSFFLPDQKIWTAENIAALKRHFINNPNVGSSSFDEKLKIQMREASSEEWVILAEAHLIYYLPPANPTLSTRRDTIQGYLRNGAIEANSLPSDFWEKIKGFSNVGQQYYKRYSQLWLILLFAAAVKQSSNRTALLGDPQAMKMMLDAQLESLPSKTDRARDMRHALLYLAFPDTHQPILSNEHRNQILRFYRNSFEITETETDLALQQIHENIARKKGVSITEVHFYQDDIKAEWSGKTSAPPIKSDIIIPMDMEDTGTHATYDPEVTQGLKKLGFTKNLIFTGAPGTGKTYTAQRVAHALVEAHVKESLSTPQIPIPLAVIEDMTIKDAIALALYLRSNGRFTNQQILGLPIMAERANSMNAKTPSSVLGTTLGTHTAPGNKYSNIASAKEPYIFDKDANGWFLSAIGRTYVEQELGDYLAMLKKPVDIYGRFEDFIQTIAFHPSYAYEDFVEGMRPVVDETGNLSYEIRLGVLRVMCNRAVADPNNRYVLIIDEINRANLSKVFGELITLIEDDKRLGAANTLTVKLPYSGDSFGIPNNLYFIGTLNTADRSIALMDIAMRRRFAFVEVPPRPELLGKITDLTGNILDLAAVMNVLNRRIRQNLGRSHEIGHSYLIGINHIIPESQLDALEHVWNTQILPLLEEYFYSRPDTLRDILKEFILEENDSGERLGFAEGEDLIIALLGLASG